MPTKDIIPEHSEGNITEYSVISALYEKEISGIEVAGSGKVFTMAPNSKWKISKINVWYDDSKNIGERERYKKFIVEFEPKKEEFTFELDI